MARVFISHSSRDNDPATRIKAWLREQGFETPFLDFDKHAGIPPGADWEKTLYREIERSEAVVVIQTPSWLDSKWCFAEFTQARALGKPIFPIIETPTGDTLIAPDIQALDLRRDREGGLEQLSRQLTQIALDAQGGFGWDASRPPYPGLLAFQEEDAAIYFGRDDDIRRLIERLNARRAQGGAKLVALLGASGSGKSSLLRAGVIPRLKRAGRNWVVLPPMRPQARPVDELARCLAVACGGDVDWRKLREDLNGAALARTLGDIAGDLRMKAAASEAQILLPVDQAEELFGASDPDQARRFFEILSAALSSDQPFIAVMALRSDYLGLLQSAERLTARYEEFSLGPMPLARIAQIIEGPARVAGLRIEEAFVHQAVRDAETEDALPLLAFALRELYDRASGDKHLSLDAYNALGDAKEGLTPLENAVRKAAHAVLTEARPGEEELAALREAFVPAMVRVNEQGEYVRRPARWDDLPARSHALLERLAKARLLIVRQEGDDRMVEVAHEALLRKWPRLRSWLDDAREFLSGKQQLERDLHDWEVAPEAEKAGALLTGLKLNRARGWLTERPHQLTARERALIQASIDHAEAAERRKVRVRRITTGASFAAALVLACVAGFALWQRNDAIKAKDEAQRNLVSANLVRARRAYGDKNVKESLFWLWRAYHDAPPADRRRESALRLIGAQAHEQSGTALQPEKNFGSFDAAISWPDFNPDHERVMISSNHNPKPSRPLPEEMKSLNFMAESPDRRTVATAVWGKNDLLQLWDLETRTPLASTEVYVNSAAFSPDGTRIVTASGETPRLWTWDAKTRELKQHKVLKGNLPHRDVTITAAYSPDGRRVVTTSEDGTARTWDAESGTLVAELKVYGPDEPGWVRAAAFSPAGGRIIAGGRVWDTETGEMIALLTQSRGKMDVAFSPNGRRVASGGEVWLLHPPACKEPAWLELSIEIRTGLAWDDEIKRPYPLSDAELEKRGDRLDRSYRGKFCDAREWEDLSPDELAALRAPGRNNY